MRPRAILGSQAATWHGLKVESGNPLLRLMWSPPKLPYRFGRFVLRERLGTGAVGTVYRAEWLDRGNRTVAIKCLHPHLIENVEIVEMFGREARVLQTLEHHNICQVLHSGTAEDIPFIVTELLDGVSLRDLWHKLAELGDAPIDEVSWIVTQICAGLHHAHEATDAHGEPMHLVHRDVSPDNILITFDGDVRLLDFGIAKGRAKFFDSVTGTGVLKGKFPYMSPQQIQGQPLDRRSDIFSLGVILWEGLTGKRLFSRPTDLMCAVAITEEPIPSVRAHRSGISDGLAATVDMALERELSARFSTAETFGTALLGSLGDSRVAINRLHVRALLMRAFPDLLGDEPGEMTRPANDMDGTTPDAPAGDEALNESWSDATEVATDERGEHYMRWAAAASEPATQQAGPAAPHDTMVDELILLDAPTDEAQQSQRIIDTDLISPHTNPRWDGFSIPKDEHDDVTKLDAETEDILPEEETAVPEFEPTSETRVPGTVKIAARIPAIGNDAPLGSAVPTPARGGRHPALTRPMIQEISKMEAPLPTLRNSGPPPRKRGKKRIIGIALVALIALVAVGFATGFVQSTAAWHVLTERVGW